MAIIGAVFRVPSDAISIDAALEGLVRLNMTQLRRHPWQNLYDGSVRYKRDHGETWDSVDIVRRRGWGDCEDLAAARAAMYRLQGIPARAVVRRSRTPGVAWHCVVKLPNGKIEDPSLRLGM